MSRKKKKAIATRKKTVSMEALKQFVRIEASNYLKRENITSVGIGYKQEGGKATKEICIQFTVGRKVAPEALEAIGEVEIPKTIVVAGVEVPTDIIERTFDTEARVVDLETKLEGRSSRKTVVDPVVPGVSVGHRVGVTAGTVGCVVYDARTGAEYVLSNWHVLNGPNGNIGDDVVQPGKHDDDRVDRNVVGKLVRSHLGIAGDCAVASIESRRLGRDILDLSVAVNQIGEPELGDSVVKSGRTTEVTYGIVTRVHTTVRIDYKGAGRKEIGCFEIGPDQDHPAKNGEISMGGDSGAVWMNVKRGKPTDLMLGLHFAGEVGDEPEHALACYPASVFEKLDVRAQKPTDAAVEDAAKDGYSASFLGSSVPVPEPVGDDVSGDLLVVEGRSKFDYAHFSLAMSKSRRFARWVAWNIDGGALRRLNRKSLQFKKDPDIPATAQVGDELYANNPLDRGHIARRADLIWGTLAEARQANVDSFYFTNITPQHETFNQSAANGIWGELENAIFADVDVADLRVSVIGGPILAESDPDYRGVQLPRQFWKVIYFCEVGDSNVKAKGFVLTQADLLNQLEVLELPEFWVYEVPIGRIGEMIGFSLCAGGERRVRRQRIRRHGSEEVTVDAIRRIASVGEILG